MSPYRAVIGLAGHVDHGKTLLIQALTGIITARAHEQAIGMTQDLGFAHFDDGQGNTIGVIDVPGHERYVRNMVAGLWSLDLVLLVIAADEGWMPMTGDHLRLLKAMGVPRLLVCINKCDLVSQEELALLEEALLERVMDESGMVPDIVSVSAKRGDNIAVLHAAIVQQLADVAGEQTARERQDPRRYREEAPPRLYVDRVFTASGTGTVLTGTLQQGRLRVGDKLRLYPAGREVQIRSLQAYHQQVDEIGAVCRVAVGLKKVPHKEVARGHCLASPAGNFLAVTHLIVRLESASQEQHSQSLRNAEVEVALGSWHGRARFVPIKEVPMKEAPIQEMPIKETRLARLIFASPVPCFFGQPLAIIRHGSSELLHGARILWCGDIHPAKRKVLHALLCELPGDLAGFNPATLRLGLDGYALASHFTEPPPATVQEGDWLLNSAWLMDTRTALLATLAQQPQSAAELATRLRIALPVVQRLLQRLKEEQQIRLHHDKWQLGSGESEDELGEEALLVLKLVRDQGKEGYEPGKLGPGGVAIDPVLQLTLPQGLRQKGALQKQLRNLARLTYLVQLEGPIYYDAELYDHMVQAVLAGQQVGDLIDMGAFKAITGLSRKYAIPFCLRMEMDGWLRREENDRRVLRLPAAQLAGTQFADNEAV